MTELNVTLSNGNVVKIQAGEKFEEIKSKLGDEVGTILSGIDNGNGVLDASEIEKFKTKLQENNYTVEMAGDGKTPKKAFNEAMQLMRNRYDSDKLKTFYKQEPADLYEVKKGDTLYDIAYETLKEEGLPLDFRSVNDRIAQIANLNNIKDVNNIRIGTKLVYKLTEAAVTKVKESGNNSAVAFGGAAASRPAANTGANSPAANTQTNPGVAAPSVNPSVEANRGNLANAIADKTSTLTVSPNGLNMGKGKPVDKDGNELKYFSDPKFAEGGKVMKYTSGETVMYQITCRQRKGALTSEVKFTGTTIEELKALEKSFDDTVAKVKAPAESETEEAAKTRKAENLTALKELVTLMKGNIQVIKNVAEKLRDDNYVDRTSDEYKAFVQDLLLTRNADVINAVIRDDNIVYTAVILEKDKTAHEILAGMYQEIRAKEKAGEKLSDEEIKLKSSLASLKGYDGYKVDADSENGVHEKYMSYFNMDGTPIYQIEIENNWYYAKDPKLLDEFLTKLESADTNEKKSALFKEYINTQDTGLAKCLAQNVKTLKAKDEDIISLVKANGMEVLATLPTPDDEEVTYSEDVFDAVISRAKEIVTADRGNLENAVGLAYISGWIIFSGKTYEENNKIITEILETYFEVTQDGEGNKTYTFNPSRRPTYEEMGGLVGITPAPFREAVVKYTKLEDMGKGQYNEAIERWYDGTYTVPHYAEMVEKMSTPEEVIDFINNKVAEYKDLHLPFDKIIEKFPDDKRIADRLVTNIYPYSTISNNSKLKLIKNYMKTEGDKVTFDKSKLPDGMPVRDFIDSILPNDCQNGDAAKYFEAALKALGKDDIITIESNEDKNPNLAKARISELVNENKTDNEFIQKVMELDKSIIPFEILAEIDAAEAKWDDKTKALVFEKMFDDRILVKDKAKHLEKAVNKHLIEKVAEDKYAIGDTIYKTDWHYLGVDDKNGTEDDTVSLVKISKTGYEHGIAMFKELDGAGSGDIAKMLRSKKEEGFENYVTPDNVVGIIDGFYTKSPKEGLMEYIANEWGWSGGVKLSKALCNRIPKALMRKATAMGLQDTDAYKKLSEFFGCSNDGTFTFTKNDKADERYDSDTAKQLDKLIKALYRRVLMFS